MNVFSWLDSASCTRLILTLGHFLWQGAAVFVVAIVVAWLLRRVSAAARYAVLAAGLMLMAACPPATFVLLGPRAEAARPPASALPVPAFPSPVTELPEPVAVTAATPPAAPTDRPAVQLDPGPSRRFDWQHYAPALAAAYLLGAALMLARLAIGLYGGQRLRRHSEPVEEAAILTAFARQARLLGLRFTPAIAYCHRVVVPTVVGVLRPMILLPFSLLSNLTPEQVEVLLAHELAHIRRHDHVINLLQRVIEAILFFHPCVWLLSRRIRAEREHCCDDVVLAAGGRRFVYAESLIRMAEMSYASGGSPLAAVAALGADGQPSQLRLRITRLLAGPVHDRVVLKRAWVLVLVLVAVGGLTLNALAPAGQSAAPEEAESASTAQGQVPVRAAADGIVSQVKVTSGQRVRKGDLLLQLDDAELALQVEAARTRLQSLQQQHDRLTQEHNAGLRDSQEPQKVALEMKLAEIELKRSALHLERSRIVSPADGTVIAASEGNLVAPVRGVPLTLSGRRVTAGEVLLYVETPESPEGAPNPRTAAGDPRGHANDVPVRSPADGLVAEVKVRDGRMVKKGELLVQLDDQESQMTMEAARARLESLRVRHEMLRSQSDAGRIPQEEVSKVAAQTKLAEIELRQIALRLERARILSPADGRVRVPGGAEPSALTGRHVAAGEILVYLQTGPRSATDAPGSATSEPSGDRPRSRCDEPTYNFTETWAGEKLEHVFVVHNDGNASLHLTKITPACGCTVIVDYDKVIEPGKWGRIPIELNTKGLNGPIVKTVSVETNDPANAKIMLMVRGTVKNRIASEPPAGASWGRVTRTSPESITVRLTNNTGTPLRLELALDQPESIFAATVKDVAPGKVYEVTVKARKPYPDGQSVAQLKFKTGIPEQPEFLLPCSLFSPPPVEVIPASIVAGMPAGQSHRQMITVRYNGQGAMNVLAVTPSSPAIKIELKAQEPGKVYSISVELPAGFETSPDQPAEIVIKTDVKGKEEIKIPIRARAATPARQSAGGRR